MSVNIDFVSQFAYLNHIEDIDFILKKIKLT